MTVYIEYVLIDNFIIDFMLLKATFILTGKKVLRIKLVLAATLGALFALIFPLLEVMPLLLTLLKIAVGLLIVSIANKFSSIKSFYINALIFFTYTFIVGGAIIGIFNIFDLDYTKEVFTAFMALPVCLLLGAFSRVIRFIYRRKEQVCLTVKVGMKKGDIRLEVNGFFDSGNAVYYNDRPVVFCNRKTASAFLDNGIRNLKIYYLTINTVNGANKKLAFDLDEIVIYNGDKSNIFNNVTLCVSNAGFSEGYDLILHPALMEGNDENKTKNKAQKVS